MATQKTIKKQLRELSSLSGSKYIIESYWYFDGSNNEIYTTRTEATENKYCNDEEGNLMIHLYISKIIDEDNAEPILSTDDDSKKAALDWIESDLEEYISNFEK